MNWTRNLSLSTFAFAALIPIISTSCTTMDQQALEPAGLRIPSYDPPSRGIFGSERKTRKSWQSKEKKWILPGERPEFLNEWEKSWDSW